jgi:hypothetical protein
MLLPTGCSSKETPVLYVLPAAKVSENMSVSELVAAALESGRRVLSGEGIAGVVWEEQLFAVLPKASQSDSVVTPASGGSSILKSTGEDVFVWVQGKKALYAGGFQKGTGTLGAQRYPYIADRERYVFAIVGDGSARDARFNKSLYQWFYSAGLIKSEL